MIDTADPEEAQYARNNDVGHVRNVPGGGARSRRTSIPNGDHFDDMVHADRRLFVAHVIADSGASAIRLRP